MIFQLALRLRNNYIYIHCFFCHIWFCSPRPQACVSRTPSSPRRVRGNDREPPIHVSRRTLWPCQASVRLPKAHGSNAATKGNEVMGEGSMTNDCTEVDVVGELSWWSVSVRELWIPMPAHFPFEWSLKE